MQVTENKKTQNLTQSRITRLLDGARPRPHGRQRQVGEVIAEIADANRIHPVRDYLRA